MALNFEFVKEITTNNQPFISYDSTSTLSNYSLRGQKEIDTTAVAQYGQYDSVVFENEGSNITTKDVTRIGGRNIPGIGTIAFYKDARTGACYIVNVVHYQAPELDSITYANGKVHIVINAPSGVHYDCYRVVMQQGDFAFEWILTEEEDDIETPMVKGDYIAYCYGYDETNGIVSSSSSTLEVNIPVGLDNWKPYSYNQWADVLERLTAAESDIDDIQAEIGDVGDLLDDLNGEVI